MQEKERLTFWLLMWLREYDSEIDFKFRELCLNSFYFNSWFHHLTPRIYFLKTPPKLLTIAPPCGWQIYENVNMKYDFRGGDFLKSYNQIYVWVRGWIWLKH